MPKPCSLELRERVVDAVRIRRVASGGGRLVRREPEFGNQMDAASAGDRKHRCQAERRQHIAAGSACGLCTVADCSAIGSHARRNRRGDAQATDRRQPQRGVALLSAAQNQRQKKVCGQRSKSAPTWPALGGAGSRAGYVRSSRLVVYRRDLSQHRHGADFRRSLPAR